MCSTQREQTVSQSPGSKCFNGLLRLHWISVTVNPSEVRWIMHSWAFSRAVQLSTWMASQFCLLHILSSASIIKIVLFRASFFISASSLGSKEFSVKDTPHHPPNLAPSCLVDLFSENDIFCSQKIIIFRF